VEELVLTFETQPSYVDPVFVYWCTRNINYENITVCVCILLNPLQITARRGLTQIMS